jgi:hypothetical protein
VLLLSLSLFVTGLVATVALLAPVVGRLASPDSWRGWLRTAPSNALAPSKTHVLAAFTPLDLGPDPVQWPSERPWPASRIAEPEWPSKSWNDDHFGTHWRKTAAHAAEVAATEAAKPARAPTPKGRQVKQEVARVPQQVARVPQQVAEWFGDDAARRELVEDANEKLDRGEQLARQAASAAAQVAKKAAAAAPRVAQVSKKGAAVANRVEAAAKKAQVAAEGAVKAAGVAKATLAGDPPSREEIRALVDEFGLAGAVKQIMDKTGWDFRTAAQHLAQHR